MEFEKFIELFKLKFFPSYKYRIIDQLIDLMREDLKVDHRYKFSEVIDDVFDLGGAYRSVFLAHIYLFACCYESHWKELCYEDCDESR